MVSYTPSTRDKVLALLTFIGFVAALVLEAWWR